MRLARVLLVVAQRFWRVFGSIVHAGLGLVYACEERAYLSGVTYNLLPEWLESDTPFRGLAGFGSCVGVLLTFSLLRVR